jgi:hypothetical protein
MTDHSSAVPPLPVQRVWSQQLTVLKGAFATNKFSINRHIYSTCQGLYYMRQFEIYKSLYNIIAEK